ncbi:S-methyl thiohydantoin desulfurase domain-containing protein [Andreprevotia chitinilytica]|uniref:S-methyl thiohydantoin desulfurase domain-containing protein n=1 Tax=Andreprevotia chitinilytica TaxID=396808 RepID=UPI000558921D|nr:DUF917 family protein [Andreprevotia chitinilytica]
MKRLSKDDLVHYEKGANIVARGSGSATPFMSAILDGDQAEIPYLMDPDKIRGHMASVVKIGATGTQQDWGGYCQQALNMLLENNGVSLSDLDGLPPIEINRSQMDRALYVCSMLDKPMIDGDYVGYTAIPSIPLTYSVEQGISLKSAYIVLENTAEGLQEKERGIKGDAYGFDAARELELTYRRLSKSAGVAAALFLTKQPRMLFPHSVTKTIQLGKSIGNRNPIDDILAFTNGAFIGSGILAAVHDHSSNDKDFNVKTIRIGNFELGIVNEFLFVDCGGQRIVRAPQIIAVVDRHGRGIRTIQLPDLIGHELFILSIPPSCPVSAQCVAEWDRIFQLHASSISDRETLAQ